MPTPLVIRDVTLVTGDAEGTVLPGRSVAVDADGRITAVAAEVTAPAGARVLDGTGRYLMPGLINAHAHVFADGRMLSSHSTSPAMEGVLTAFVRTPVGSRLMKRRARESLLTQMRAGVTTVRTLGDTGYEVVAIRNAVEAGDYLGPRILASGPLMAATGGHGAPLLAMVSDSPWDARRNVRKSLRAGVNAIKIAATGGVTDARALGEAGRPQMTETEMAAICEEAHNAGLVVAAHAQSPAGVAAALRAGVDTIEHGASMTEEIISLYKDNPRSLRGWSAFVPTIMAALPMVHLDPSTTKVAPVVRENGRLVLEQMVQGVQDALDNDVVMGMGTDSSLTFITHYNAWREIDYISRYSAMPLPRALHAATQANARILGVDGETGAVEVGRYADLVLLDANPLQEVRTLAEPRAVVVRGHILDKPEVEKFPEVEAQLDTI